MFTRLVREGMSKEKQQLIANLFNRELKLRQKENAKMQRDLLQAEEYERNAQSLEPLDLKIALDQDSRNHSV